MKRLFDLIVSSTLLICLFPIMVAVSVALAWHMGSPVLFRQQRPGLYGKPFEVLKFRTMADKFDSDGVQLPDEHRLTAFGKLLRRLSLDELPQLINVIKGDMSLVGPRPLLMEYLPLYSAQQMRRHDVRPGITGWAQINGRNNLSWDEKFALDVWYVDNRSLWLDLQILVKTISRVFVGAGVAKSGFSTTDKFSARPALPDKTNND